MTERPAKCPTCGQLHNLPPWSPLNPPCNDDFHDSQPDASPTPDVGGYKAVNSLGAKRRAVELRCVCGHTALWHARLPSGAIPDVPEVAVRGDAPTPEAEELCDHGIPLCKAISHECQKCWDACLDGAMEQAESGAGAHIRAGAPFNPCPNIHQPCVICEALRERQKRDAPTPEHDDQCLCRKCDPHRKSPVVERDAPTPERTPRLFTSAEMAQRLASVGGIDRWADMLQKWLESYTNRWKEEEKIWAKVERDERTPKDEIQPFAPQPDMHREHTEKWLKSNQKKPLEVLWSLYPVGMVGRWIERAEKAEEELLQARAALVQKEKA